MSQNHVRHFPSKFMWGSATSAYQIEGAWNSDGKGASIWDIFSHQSGRTYQGDHGDSAADHYRLWQNDIDRMAELGLQAYRFSISWPRVFPSGSGIINLPGLDFYDRLVDALLAKNIEPILTLYHWDLPQALQDDGGWANRETVYRFADYSRQVAKRLGDRVKWWTTHNEPLVVAMSGHFLGDHAPGIQDPRVALQVIFNLLLSHGLATKTLRSILPPESQVGVALNLNPFYPASESEADYAAARRAEAVLNGLMLEPLFKGRIPAEIQEMFGPMLPTLQPGDFETIQEPIDFLGINYYSRIVIRDDPTILLGQASQVQPEGNEYSQMWEIYPQGLYDLLSQVHRQYQPKQILITENGVPVVDGLDFDGRVRDYRRIRFLRDHLVQLQHAINAGIPVSGYFVWSLLDNFEWAYGYRMRFGLVYVDFETQARTIKDSGRWYAKVIQQNGLDPQENIPEV